MISRNSSRHGEVDWKIGSCSLRLAHDLRLEGEDQEALARIERTIALEQPRSDQARAYFEMGEILSDLGRCDEAMDAFLQVRRADQTGTSPLVERAQWRFDELRFVGPTGGRFRVRAPAGGAVAGDGSGDSDRSGDGSDDGPSVGC